MAKENAAERGRIKYDIDFNTIKSAIRKSYSFKSFGIGFIIDYPMLDNEISNYGLQCLWTNPNSKPIKEEDVTGIAEFYKGSKLTWINEKKEFANIIFIKTEAIDELAEELLSNLRKPQIDVPGFDRIEAIATLLAKYPCYTATCVSYKSSDPKRGGIAGMEISMRASTVTIKNDNYRYRAPDMVGYNNEHNEVTSDN